MSVRVCPDCARLVNSLVNGPRCPYCRTETFEIQPAPTGSE